MTTQILLALIAFAFVTSITPGPNNLMLLASGVNFGFRATVPHMFGISIGFAVMMVAVGLGLHQLFERVPVTFVALKVAGALYMLWLAYKIAVSAAPSNNRVSRGRPMTFLQAAAFQWVNPKAWIMAVTAVAAYTQPDRFVPSVALVALICGAVNLPAVSTWALFGTGLRTFLSGAGNRKIFNVGMALLLVASLFPLVVEFVKAFRAG